MYKYMYVYMYMYTCVYMQVYIYTHVYIYIACVGQPWPSAACEGGGGKAPYRIGHQRREPALKVLHIASARLARVHARLRHDLPMFPMFPVRFNAYAMPTPAPVSTGATLRAQLDPRSARCRETGREAPR